jgi:hypothetical protein
MEVATVLACRLASRIDPNSRGASANQKDIQNQAGRRGTDDMLASHAVSGACTWTGGRLPHYEADGDEVRFQASFKSCLSGFVA